MMVVATFVTVIAAIANAVMQVSLMTPDIVMSVKSVQTATNALFMVINLTKNVIVVVVMRSVLVIQMSSTVMIVEQDFGVERVNNALSIAVMKSVLRPAHGEVDRVSVGYTFN